MQARRARGQRTGQVAYLAHILDPVVGIGFAGENTVGQFRRVGRTTRDDAVVAHVDDAVGFDRCCHGLRLFRRGLCLRSCLRFATQFLCTPAHAGLFGGIFGIRG